MGGTKLPSKSYGKGGDGSDRTTARTITLNNQQNVLKGCSILKPQGTKKRKHQPHKISKTKKRTKKKKTKQKKLRVDQIILSSL